MKTNDPAMAVRSWPARLWETSPALVGVALVHVGLIALFLVGFVVDARMVTGQPVWMKPAKFAASIFVYTLTLAWMLSHVEGQERRVRAIGGVTAAAMVVEIVIIGAQAARGVRSHFNAATALDGALFTVMGVAILTAWGCGVAALVLLFRQRMVDGVLGWGIRLGLLLSLLGAGLGGLMTRPSQAQLEQFRRGTPLESGAHSVGVQDGGRGLPVLGWSTEGGDLRVPHFFGLHAMQVLPLLAAWLSRGRSFRRLHSRRRMGLVWASALAYGGTILVLTWQALRAEPIVSPGPTTLWALGGVVGAALVLAATSLRGTSQTNVRGSDARVTTTARAEGAPSEAPGTRAPPRRPRWWAGREPRSFRPS
ncbi:MAG: hypothetical protein L0Y66_15355 [Myxococcaceae bacterium]|nr:hypothetical protein [Myxococcaceae bacterium]MCI0670179.1 hypothetical protein [Myxococcaceae bacterium]